MSACEQLAHTSGSKPMKSKAMLLTSWTVLLSTSNLRTFPFTTSASLGPSTRSWSTLFSR